MHVIFVRHRYDAVCALGGEQNLIGNRARQRSNPAASEIANRTKLSGVRRTYTQNLAELIIRKRYCVPGAARGCIFDTTQPDVGVTAGDGLIDLGEGDFDE